MGLKPKLAPKRNCIKDEATEARQTLRLDMALCIWRLAARILVWWSQTGSNRRPHACKARALPTELWPLSQGKGQDGKFADALSSDSPRMAKWWAWEDLNFRPHAYQARALTN